MVREARSIPCANRSCMPSRSAAITVSAAMPERAMFCSSLPVRWSFSCRIAYAGTPARTNMFNWPTVVLPVACITPKARVIRWTPAIPVPAVNAASPMSVSSPVTSPAWKPNVWSIRRGLDELVPEFERAANGKLS
jgi:hypothetical protein